MAGLAQMVIATDITRAAVAEEQAARQAERAQSVSRLITMGEMASSVAWHELNQPLTAINNYCSGMVSRIQNGTLRREALLTALQKPRTRPSAPARSSSAFAPSSRKASPIARWPT